MRLRPCVRLLASMVLLLAPARALAVNPSLELEPPQLRPGEPLLITVRNAAKKPRIAIGDRELTPWRIRGGWRVVAGLPVEQAAGRLEVRAQVAKSAPLVGSVIVDAPDWRTRELEVAPKFTSPPPPALARRLAADRRAFERAFARSSVTPRFSKRFVLPRAAAVTAPFGDRRTFNGKTESQHYGVDLDGRVGAPVVAANDGLVVMVRDNVAAGRTVVLDHGAGLFTTYFHLSRIGVKAGQRVRRGARLGAVGRTGRVTGPHLHFGAKVDGLYVDPEALVRLDFAPPSRARRGSARPR